MKDKEASSRGLSDEVERQNAGFDRCFEALGFSSDHGFERSWSSLVLEIQRILTRASAATVFDPAEKVAPIFNPDEKIVPEFNPAATRADSLEFRLLDAIKGMANCIADPMWSGHAEVSKANLKRWHKLLHDIRAAQSGQRAGGFDHNNEQVQRFAIEVEKLLCKVLGREWTPAGISIESLIAELAGQRAGVAEGWQLVPKEPTDDMIQQLVSELQGECVNIFKPEGWWEDIRSALRDAIAAAPTQQQEEE